jgi:hypothetical protein
MGGKLDLYGATALLGLLIISSGTTAASQTDNVKIAQVRVIVCDPFGTPQSRAVVELLDMDRRIVATNAQGQPIQVPYGKYVLRTRLGNGVSHRTVTVFSPTVTFLTSAPLIWGDRQEYGWLRLKVHIMTSRKLPDELYLRVRGLFLDVSREAVVADKREIDIEELESGRYVIEIFTRDKILHTSVVEVDEREPIAELTIKL